MPKRTNLFQQVIHHIYSQMAPTGFTVTESALLDEREIDILIEGEVAGTTLRIAVECRDRSRKDDIEWIDGLVGKYLDMDVQKVIAVSNSGFSQRARDKAAANRIEIRTPQQALSTDWTSEFIKLGMLKYTRQTSLESIIIDTEPLLTVEPKMTNVVTDQDGVILASLGEFLDFAFYHKAVNDLQEYLTQHFWDYFKVVADFHKTLLCEQRLKAPNIYLVADTGASYKITFITFLTKSVFSIDKAQVQHHTFEKALITTGVIDFTEAAIKHNFGAVQVAGQNQVKIFINPEKAKKK